MSHAPNPQMCAAAQRVWDDSTMQHPSTFGGACLTPLAASQTIGSNPAAYEVLTINVTFDPNSFDFQGLEALPITCIRARDPRLWAQNAQVYGRVCASRVDRPHLPVNLPSHPWDSCKWQDSCMILVCCSCRAWLLPRLHAGRHPHTGLLLMAS